MRRIYFLPLLLILVLALAACGGDGDNGGTAQEPADGDTPADGGDGQAAEQPGTGVDVTMARATWDTGFFQAQIYYELLSDLGYNVEHPSENQLGAVNFYQACNEGDVDFWANGWFPLHDQYLQDAQNCEAVGTQIQAGAFQGYLIDAETAEAEGITSIEQIDDNPELASMFDYQGDERGDLVGCNSGWGCFDTIEQHINEGELGDNIQHVSAQYSALMTDLVARYERGEPVLWYTWTPNWTVNELVPGEDVVWLESPSHPNEQEPVPGDQVPGGEEACAGEPPCDIGWAANDIRVAANSEFLENNPAAEALFEEVQLTVSRIAEQNAKMNQGEDSREDIARHAQQWIQENQDQVNEWLQTAREAASGSSGSSGS